MDVFALKSPLLGEMDEEPIVPTESKECRNHAI